MYGLLDPIPGDGEVAVTLSVQSDLPVASLPRRSDHARGDAPWQLAPRARPAGRPLPLKIAVKRGGLLGDEEATETAVATDSIGRIFIVEDIIMGTSWRVTRQAQRLKYRIPVAV